MITISILEEPTGKSRTLTGHATFTANDGEVFFIDGGAADRNFNPSGTFPAFWQIKVINTGSTNNIIFDSAVSGQTILPGYMGVFVYNGTIWY